jgi:septum formation protein
LSDEHQPGASREARSRLVLASGSPQRRAILGDLGLDFDVRPSDVPEEHQGVPREVAAENALRKARAVSETAGADEVVLGCDTLVATDETIWGKPADEAAARATLRHLSGRTHEVISGVALVEGGEIRTATEVTHVTFRELDEATIDWYVSCGEWNGRAGGYAIQGRGAVLIRRIEGDYLNVVGLPVAALLDVSPHLMTDHAARR